MAVISLSAKPAHGGEKWHLDEVVIKIKGRLWWLWRAVDQHGAVLDVLVQSRRNAQTLTRRLHVPDPML